MTSALTHAHKAQQTALRAQALRELTSAWSVLDAEDLDRTFPQFAALASALIRRGHSRSAALAAVYYRALRRANGVREEDLSRVLELPSLDPARVATSLSVTTIAGTRIAQRAGRPPAEALGVAAVLAAGATTRLVLAGGRDLLEQASRRDRRAQGMTRVVSSSACSWCADPDARGFHDHCNCSLEPRFSP